MPRGAKEPVRYANSGMNCSSAAAAGSDAAARVPATANMAAANLNERFISKSSCWCLCAPFVFRRGLNRPAGLLMCCQSQGPPQLMREGPDTQFFLAYAPKPGQPMRLDDQ